MTLLIILSLLCFSVSGLFSVENQYIFTNSYFVENEGFEYFPYFFIVCIIILLLVVPTLCF